MLSELARRAYRRWLRPDARNSLAIGLMLCEHDRWPRALDEWPERRVVVVAPHPDDEAIGCAGAVLRHVEAGATVTVVQVSDGRWGDRRLLDPTLTDAARDALQQELVATRRREAEAWAAGSGAQVRFLGAEDGAIGPRDDWARRLAGWLDELQPQRLYLPFLMELPEDHWQTCRLVDAALARCHGRWRRTLALRSYEVWTPLVANRVLPLGPLAERKQALLALYASQLRDVDYRRCVDGLNAWRSMLLPGVGVGAAEAFFDCSLPAWRALMARRPAEPHPR